MGVQQLWSLLEPAARPVDMSALEGKILAVDASIWLHQIVRAMRDKRGELVHNAHIHAMLTRLCKLMHHGVRPVFVFDGSAPAIKKAAIAERRKKISSGQSDKQEAHRKLLENQIKRKLLGVPDVTPGRLQAAAQRRKNNADDMFALPTAVQTAALEADSDEDEDEDEDEAEADEEVMQVEPRGARRHPSSASKRNRDQEETSTLRDEALARALQAEEYAEQPSSRSSTRAAVGDSGSQEDVSASQGILVQLNESAPMMSPSKAKTRSRRGFRAGTRFTLDAGTVDVFSREFDMLPLEIQYEIVMEKRELNKNKSKRGTFQASALNDSFSQGQLLRVVQRDRLNKKLEDIRKALLKSDALKGLSVQKVASEDNTVFVLAERTDDIDLPDTPEKPASSSRIKHRAKDKDDDDDSLGVEPLPVEPAPSAPQQHVALSAKENTGRVGSTADVMDVAADDDNASNSSLSFADDFSDDEQAPKAVDETAAQAKADQEPVIVINDEDEEAPLRLPRVDSQSEEPLPYSFGERQQLASTAMRKFLGMLDSQDHLKPRTIEEEERVQASGWSRPLQSHVPHPRIRKKEAALVSSKLIELSDSDGEASSAESEGSEQAPAPANATAAAADDNSVQVPIPSAEPRGAAVATQSSTTVEQAYSATSPDAIEVASDPESVIDAPVELATETHVDVESAGSPAVVDEEHKQRPSQDSEAAASDEVIKIEDSDDEQDDIVVATRIADVRTDSPPKQHHKSVEIAPGINAEEALSRSDKRDEAVSFLNKEKQLLASNLRRAAQAAGDVTSDMITDVQQMLSLFGCPYIVAPQEAESQCAALEVLGLTDGSITDDNDIFLFGGKAVYRHFCSRTKDPTLYLATDLDELIGLTRERLISLAHLLGSDYNAGLKGIGPVTAMEILGEFRGEDSLGRFARWFRSIKSPDVAKSSDTVVMVKLQKQLFNKLKLPKGFPNRLITQAYQHPVVDRNEETFEWGQIDIEGLRAFVQEKLGWDRHRADDHVLPLIRRNNERQTQRKINSYFLAQPRDVQKRGDGNGTADAVSRSSDKRTADRDRAVFVTERLHNAIARVRGVQAKQILASKKRTKTKTDTKAKSAKKKKDKQSKASDQETERDEDNTTSARSGAGQPKKKAAKKMSAATAFQFWLQAAKPEIKQALGKEATGREVVAEASQRWRAMPEEDKAAWTDKFNTFRAGQLASEIDAINQQKAEYDQDELMIRAAEAAEQAASQQPASTRRVHDADGFFASLKPPAEVVQTVTVNRGPVLVLWVAVVANASGHTWSEALTFGRCIANKFAATKGKYLDMGVDEQASLEHELAHVPGAYTFKFMGVTLPVVKVSGQVRAVSSSTPIDPLRVLAQLRSRFADTLASVLASFQRLALSVPNPIMLQEDAYALYERFRPSVPHGRAGWGAAGVLDLSVVEQCAAVYLEQQQEHTFL